MPTRSPIHRTGSYSTANTRPQRSRGGAGAPSMVASVMSATVPARSASAHRTLRPSSRTGLYGRSGSNETQARRLRDRGRTRAPPKLVSDVRYVPVDRVRAENELAGNLPLAQPARDEPEHLTLTAGQQHRRGLALNPLGFGVGHEERAQRANHRL